MPRYLKRQTLKINKHALENGIMWERLDLFISISEISCSTLNLKFRQSVDFMGKLSHFFAGLGWEEPPLLTAPE
jgi:hypothetical protein